MPTSPDQPPTLRPAAQILLGLLIGLLLAGLVALLAVLGVPVTRYAWVAIFLTLWVATYAALKTRLRLLIAVAAITILSSAIAFLTLAASHLHE